MVPVADNTGEICCKYMGRYRSDAEEFGSEEKFTENQSYGCNTDKTS